MRYQQVVDTGSPQAITDTAGQWTQLTNAKAVGSTNFLRNPIDLWDAGANELDFTGVQVGSLITVQLVGTVSAGLADTTVSLRLRLNIGGAGGEVLLPGDLPPFDAGVTQIPGVALLSIPVSSLEMASNPGRIEARADARNLSITLQAIVFGM